MKINIKYISICFFLFIFEYFLFYLPKSFKSNTFGKCGIISSHGRSTTTNPLCRSPSTNPVYITSEYLPSTLIVTHTVLAMPELPSSPLERFTGLNTSYNINKSILRSLVGNIDYLFVYVNSSHEFRCPQDHCCWTGRIKGNPHYWICSRTNSIGRG